jgi:hypothetical protein
MIITNGFGKFMDLLSKSAALCFLIHQLISTTASDLIQYVFFNVFGFLASKDAYS